MASILRSSKFVRYFAGLARNIIFNTTKEVEGNFVQQSQCFCNGLSQGFATAMPRNDQSLDRSLKKLDQDVRRSGRISRRDIEEVLEEIRQHRSATSSQSLLVIRCCGNLVPEELPEVRTTLVQEIWKTLNNLNVPMDISHYNALLRVYLENEHQFSPTEFLADLELKGIEPNRVTYQRLISRYCQQGDIDGATRILEFMREKQLPVNENVFNALIMGHSQADDMESAAGILSVMQQAGLEPSADTYTILLCGYAKTGDIDSIQRTLEICEKKDIFLLDKDLLDVIYALAINGHDKLVDAVLTYLRKSSGFNHDAVNIILRLTNKGHEDVAFKILKTMPRNTKPDGELNDTGHFFIKQLVKANRSPDKILSICKELEEQNLNKRAILTAIEATLVQGATNIAFPLLVEAKKRNLLIRQHYFWPLICTEAQKGTEAVLEVLRSIQNDFDISLTGETIREYVIPNLKEKDSNKIIHLLRTVGVSISTASSSTAFYFLNDKHNIKEAAEITSNYTAYYAPGLFRKALVQALIKSNDYASYIKLVRQIHDSLTRLDNFKHDNEEIIDESTVLEKSSQNVNQAETLGQMVFDVLVQFRNNRAEAMNKILNGLVDQGLSISNKQAEKIQEKLGSELTPEISTLLGKLVTGDLEPIPIERSAKMMNSSTGQMSVEQIEKLIETLEAKGENTKSLKRYLLAACFKSKDVSKSEEVVSKLENSGYVLSSGVYAQLIDLYCQNNNVDKVMEVYEKILAREPDFKLDEIKAIKMANVLVNANKVDAAIEFLEKNKSDEQKPESNSFNYTTTCWRLLNSLAESGKSDDLNKLFNVMCNNNYIIPNNVLLGPLVKVHLINNDLTKAVDTFEEICTKNKMTPWKNELACRLIQNEDATNLQRLTDLSTNIHGEVNSLYDLVFSFVECGRIRQARKILETPGLKNRPQRINIACERYRHEGMTKPLEDLMEATKDLNHIDRADIYYNLLLSYIKADQPDKSLNLWTKMQEEDITPSDAFLIKLAEYLKSKDFQVPFVVPAAPKETTVIQTNAGTVDKNQVKKGNESKKTSNDTANKETKKFQEDKKVSSAPISTELQNLKQAIRAGDVDNAITMKQRMFEAKEKLTVTDQSHLIELLVKNDRLNEATKSVFSILETNSHPIPRIFRYYLNKVALVGDVETLDKIDKLIKPDIKKVISFDNRYCHANIVAGKVEDYLKKLENDIDMLDKDADVSVIAEKFPRGGAVGILEVHPEMSQKFEEIAEKYAKRGIISPMNVLWMHYFVNENTDGTKRIWDKYLATAPRLMFQRIVHLARDKQDEHLIHKLIDVIKNTNVSEGAIGNAYSCLLDIYAAKENYDGGLLALNNAIKDVSLEQINRTALLRIKTGLEKTGKVFPHKIPEKVNKNNAESSSSSSSDDEPSTKKK